MAISQSIYKAPINHFVNHKYITKSIHMSIFFCLFKYDRISLIIIYDLNDIFPIFLVVKINR